MAHLSAAADILVFPPARRLRYCQMCRIMLNSQETKPLTLIVKDHTSSSNQNAKNGTRKREEMAFFQCLN
jgi:hypothetical protein